MYLLRRARTVPLASVVPTSSVGSRNLFESQYRHFSNEKPIPEFPEISNRSVSPQPTITRQHTSPHQSNVSDNTDTEAGTPIDHVPSPPKIEELDKYPPLPYNPLQRCVLSIHTEAYRRNSQLPTAHYSKYELITRGEYDPILHQTNANDFLLSIVDKQNQIPRGKQYLKNLLRSHWHTHTRMESELVIDWDNDTHATVTDSDDNVTNDLEIETETQSNDDDKCKILAVETRHTSPIQSSLLKSNLSTMVAEALTSIPENSELDNTNNNSEGDPNTKGKLDLKGDKKWKVYKMNKHRRRMRLKKKRLKNKRPGS